MNTHEQLQNDMDSAAQVINAALREPGDCVDMEVADLEAAGLPLHSLAYADWLHQHRLRMRRVGRSLVRFTRMT